MRRAGLRLLNAIGVGRPEQDLDRELAAHEALIADELERQGVAPDHARVVARRRLGRVDRIKEDHREARSIRLVDDARQDARYALRMLRRSPAVSAVVIGSLAIGIGANTVAFSLRDSLLARTLPVPRPSELVNVRALWPGSRPRSETPTWEFNGLRDGSASLMILAAVAVFDQSNVTLNSPDGTTLDGGRSRVAIVSGNYFEMLQIPAATGRVLTPDDDRVRGGHPVAVLSGAYWRSRLAASPDVLGRTVTINRTPFTIVGVMPHGFTGDWIGRPVDVWVPTMMQGAVMIEAPDALIRPNDYWLRQVGRLNPGVTRAGADAAMQPLYQRVMREGAAIASTVPLDSIAQQRLELVPGSRGFSPVRDALTRFTLTLAGVAALVLLTVSANVAGILLARSVSRQRELALRLAIGANRARLARQLVVEGLVLASIGGLLGTLLAAWCTRALATALATAPVQMFWASSSWQSYDVALSWRGLALTTGLSILAGTVCGLVPLLRARSKSFSPALSLRGDGGGVGSRLLVSRLLVVAQIALALVILAAASLLARSLGSLREQPLGFDRDNLVLVWTQPSSTGRQGQALRDLWREATARIASLPGVAAAGAWNSQVLGGGMATPGRAVEHIHVDGQPARLSPLPGGRTFVTPGIFTALGVPLLAGREFTDRDTETSPPVGIINETMARVYFEGENPVGRHVRFGSSTAPLVEIVGVVRDFEAGTPRGVGQRRMQTFFPYRASAGGQLVIMCVAIRTLGDPAPLMTRVRETLRSVDPSLAVLEVNTVDQQLDRAPGTGSPAGGVGRRFCRGLRTAVVPRPLRIDCAPHRTPHHRDRRAHGARSNVGKRVDDGAARWGHAGDLRRGRGSSRGHPCRPVDRVAVVPGWTLRSADHWLGLGRHDGGDAGGGLAPGAPRRARESDRRAARRIAGLHPICSTDVTGQSRSKTKPARTARDFGYSFFAIFASFVLPRDVSSSGPL